MKKLQFKFDLKKAIQEKNLSQRDFVEESGIRYQVVGEMATGRLSFDKNPMIENLMTLMDYFGIDDLNELVEVVETPEERVYRKKVMPRYDHNGKRIQEEA